MIAFIFILFIIFILTFGVVLAIVLFLLLTKFAITLNRDVKKELKKIKDKNDSNS